MKPDLPALLPTLLLSLLLGPARLPAAVTPGSAKIPVAVPDRQDFPEPDRVRLGGWLGTRVGASESNRLAKIDPARLLEGYRKRPGRQAWDGEHVGKWLHAATLAWVNTGDPALRSKLDYMVDELIKCQEADGYLGTYLPKDRWTEWDVWAHKYNLLGLLTYMRHTGNATPLPACRRMADLLCRTFGDQPGQRDILQAGHHVGMAPTSVLEPMVLLARLTGEARYREFCDYILRAWEQPHGPHILSRLLEGGRVDKVGNGKAYEMLSCLVGALEYHRTFGGEHRILEACRNAWQDIVDKRLYLTGAASYAELFHDDYDLPNMGSVGETCVTTTWIQFNAQLLRLTGEARFAEQLERVVLNQLLGAQRPDCAAWGYYVQMEGTKPYSDSLDGHCCLSSGPRGIALIPTFTLGTDADGVVVNLYEAGTGRLTLRDGTTVRVITETRFPAEERIRIAVQPDKPTRFSLKLRRPAWCRLPSADVNGETVELTAGSDGYAVLRRTWKAGDAITLHLPLRPQLVVGEHRNRGKVAVLHGPLVLAADEALLAGDSPGLGGIGIAAPDLPALGIRAEPAPATVKSWPGAQVFRIHAQNRRTGAPLDIRLIPFADAGGTGTRYKVWLPLPRASGGNLLLDGTESRSRPGNRPGSIIDDDLVAPVVTFDGRPAREDWFAVTLEAPARIGRMVFVHGQNFHDGGWFDAGQGRPRLQVQRTPGGGWETVADLTDYPATSAAMPGELRAGQAFAVHLARPLEVIAVRVVGVPAGGDNPKQAFASCAELQAFAE